MNNREAVLECRRFGGRLAEITARHEFEVLQAFMKTSKITNLVIDWPITIFSFFFHLESLSTDFVWIGLYNPSLKVCDSYETCGHLLKGLDSETTLDLADTFDEYVINSKVFCLLARLFFDTGQINLADYWCYNPYDLALCQFDCSWEGIQMKIINEMLRYFFLFL